MAGARKRPVKKTFTQRAVGEKIQFVLQVVAELARVDAEFAAGAADLDAGLACKACRIPAMPARGPCGWWSRRWSGFREDCAPCCQVYVVAGAGRSGEGEERCRACGARRDAKARPRRPWRRPWRSPRPLDAEIGNEENAEGDVGRQRPGIDRDADVLLSAIISSVSAGPTSALARMPVMIAIST